MRYALALFLAALALPPASTAQPGGAPEACKLLSPAELGPILGAGYASVAPLGSREMCLYRKSAAELVGLTVVNAPGGAAKTLKEVAAMVSRTQKVNPVEGLGEGAFWVVSSSTNKMGLHVGKGERRAVIEVVVGGKPDVAAAQKVAKVVLSHL